MESLLISFLWQAVWLPCLFWTVALTLILWRARRDVKRQLTIFFCLHLIVPAMLLPLVIQRYPTVHTAELSTEDKIALRDSYRQGRTDSIYHLELSEQIAARGIRSAASIVGLEVHPDIELLPNGRWHVTASCRLPGSWINLQASGRAKADRGRVDAQLTAAQLGRLPIPGWLADALAQRVLKTLSSQPPTSRGIQGIKRLRISDGELLVQVHRDLHLVQRTAAMVQSPRERELAELATEILDHGPLDQHLSSRSSAVDGQPSGDRDFMVVTRQLFVRAAELRPDWSAARRNQAAILAGGIIMGHHKLADAIGVPSEAWRGKPIAKAAGRATCHGRRDLAQHFWVSAALVVVGSSELSRVAGISKEEMDMGANGSGFSFADLLADRAGTRLAELAVSPDSAAHMAAALTQRRWNRVEQLVPSIEGLPEGIPLEVFDQQYGGIQGEEFGRWSDRIDTRLEELPDS